MQIGIQIRDFSLTRALRSHAQRWPNCDVCHGRYRHHLPHETSNIIHGGETSYIMATVTL